MLDIDSADLDAVLELAHSPGYDQVVRRLNEQLERLRRELESAPLERIQNLQGRIAAFTTALEIPSILAAEYTAALKGQKR